MLKHINWTSANIAVWNKTRFPKNTSERQLIKLSGEIAEWKNAKGATHKLEELADVFIAAAGLTRFGGNYGVVGGFLCYLLQLMDGEGEKKGMLRKAVHNKMAINIERQFDENMHHI